MEKMTYVAALSYVLTNCTLPDEVSDKLSALKAQTEKRNSSDRKPTKTQVANLSLADKIAEVLRYADKPLTVTEIMSKDPDLSILSNQKVSAVIRTMDDRVIKTVEKRVSKFSLA